MKAVRSRGRGWGLLAALALLTRCAQPSAPGEPAPPEAPGAEVPDAAPGDTGVPPAQPGPVEEEKVPATPSPQTLTFAPTADVATLRGGEDSGLGRAPTLQVRRSAERTSYAIEAATHLHFEPQGLRGTVTRAVLRLYALQGSPDGVTLALNTNALWGEDPLIATLRPGTYAPVLNAGAVADASWMELDVTSILRGDGALDVTLQPDFDSGVATGKGLVFASREHADAGLRPQLVVTVDPAREPPAGEQSGCGTAWKTEVLLPTDDASVPWSGSSSAEATGPRLRVGGPESRAAYLRFVVPERDGKVPRAVRLRVYVPEGGPVAPRLSSGGLWSWNEGNLLVPRYLPAELSGPPGPVARGSWVEYDVTDLVMARGVLGFALTSATAAELQLASRESEDVSLRPQLLVTRGAPCVSRGEGGALAWSRQAGSETHEGLGSLATFADGSFVTLGLGVGTVPGEYAWVLTRYTPEGAPTWRRLFTLGAEAGSLGLWALATAPDGSVVVTGGYEGAPDLGAGPLPEADRQSLFVARLTAAGQTLWSRGYGSAQLGLAGSHVAVDAQGNIAVAGQLQGTVDFGGGPLRGGVFDAGSAEQSMGSYLLVLDAEGAYRGSTALPNAPAGTYPQSAVVNAVAFDSKGNVVLGGVVGEGSVLGGQGPNAPFVARYAPTGALRWYRRFEGLEGTVASVAVGPRDELVFGGFFSRQYTFAGTQHASGPGGDLLLGALSAEGGELWARDLPGSGSGRIERLVINDTGHVTVLAGLGSGDLGGGRLGPGLVVARYALTDGAHRWSHLLRLDEEPGGASFLLAAQPQGRTLLGTHLYSTAAEPYTLPLDGSTHPYANGSLLLLQLAP